MNELATMNVKELTPEQLGGEIRLLTMQARRMALSFAIQIGYRLHIAHEKVGPHGWAEWLKKETDFSPASASRFESLYEGYGADQGNLLGVENKFPTLEKLSVSNALKLLAIPEEERESFAEEVDAEHLSARKLEALVKERTATLEAEKQKLSDAVEVLTHDRDGLRADMDQIEEKLGFSEQERAKAEEQLLRIQQELREIESRPQPVAVERDEQAIQEAAEAARKSAEKEAAKKIAELKEQISATASSKNLAEKELEKLRGKISEAEKAGAESEKLRAQIKDLEGQLTLASPEVAAFKAAFDRAQAELVTMLKALRKVQDAEVKAKLSTAARTVLANFAGQIEG